MKEKINEYTFNVIAYANTFTWLDNEEKKHMAGVLWQAWVKLRPKKEDRHDEFDIVHEAAGMLFGEFAFRKSFGHKKRTPINKALFEVWCSSLSTMGKNEFNRLKSNTDFMNEYNLLLDDSMFNRYISRDSWKNSSVKQRYEKINKLINKYTK